MNEIEKSTTMGVVDDINFLCDKTHIIKGLIGLELNLESEDYATTVPMLDRLLNEISEALHKNEQMLTKLIRS